MKKKMFGHTEVEYAPDATEKEIENTIAYLEKKYNRKVKTLVYTTDGDEVDLDFTFEEVPFERIRRITGYLVGTMDQWNNAKAAEEHDRVKHDTATPTMETL